MSRLLIKLVRFNKGYRVGFRHPEELIDHSTILRALLNVAYMLNDKILVDKICTCAASSLLPAVPCRDKSISKLLVPFPTIPVRGKEAKGIRWTTLTAAKKILEHVNSCLEQEGFPIAYVETTDSKSLVVECYRDGNPISSIRLSIKVGHEINIVCIDGELEELADELEPPFFRIDEIHSRIDRITTAADLYRVSGFGHRYYLWFGILCPDDLTSHVETALKILSRLGLGSCRSRGWGQFEVFDADNLNISERDKKLLSSVLKPVDKGLNMLLGALILGPWINKERSFIKHRIISGFSGSPELTYKLPMLIVADSGSIVYIEDFSKYEATLKVKTEIPNFEPVLIFNPLTIRVG